MTQSSWKIIIDGHDDAGVATFVRTISDRHSGKTGPLLSSWENTQDGAPSLGRVTIDRDLVLFFLGNDLEREWPWDHFDQHLLGVILLVDSADPGSFRETGDLLNALTSESPVPYVLAANKQDLPEAWNVTDIRIAMQLPETTPIIPCVASDRESVRDVLNALFDRLMRTLEG